MNTAPTNRPVFGPTKAINAPQNARRVSPMTGSDDEERFPQSGGKPDAVTEEIKALMRKPARPQSVPAPQPGSCAGIAIEDGIPIPPQGGRRRQGVHLVLEQTMRALKVGQSFVSPLNAAATLNVLKAVRKATKSKFTTRDIGDKRVRVWRTA